MATVTCVTALIKISRKSKGRRMSRVKSSPGATSRGSHGVRGDLELEVDSVGLAHLEAALMDAIPHMGLKEVTVVMVSWVKMGRKPSSVFLDSAKAHVLGMKAGGDGLMLRGGKGSMSSLLRLSRFQAGMPLIINQEDMLDLIERLEG